MSARLEKNKVSLENYNADHMKEFLFCNHDTLLFTCLMYSKIVQSHNKAFVNFTLYCFVEDSLFCRIRRFVGFAVL